MIGIPGIRKRDYCDIDVVNGLQARNARVEEWFYNAARRYFNYCFKEVFFNEDYRQEIFQSAFIKLWTEIENGRIKVVEGAVCRQQRNGVYEPMTCSLTTFLMAFARTEYRELVRNVDDECYEGILEREAGDEIFAFEADGDDADELKNRIVDECLMQMSPSCSEILTLFYHRGKSLDEIMEIRGERNSSKDGLKSAKNKCMNLLRQRVLKEYAKCNI